MIVGVISDTHDRIPLIIEAVERLNAEGAGLILHCGDYCAPFAMKPLGKLNARMIGVYGNNDAEKELLKEAALKAGNEIKGGFARLIVDGWKVALLHGEDSDLLSSLIECGYFDLVAYGHTHEAEVRTVGRTLVVNPGEVCGYLTNEPSLALLNTKTKEAKLVKIGRR